MDSEFWKKEHDRLSCGHAAIVVFVTLPSLLLNAVLLGWLISRWF